MARKLSAIHLRHLQISDDNLRKARGRLPQRSTSVICQHNVVSSAFKRQLQRPLIFEVIVDQ